MFLRPVKLAKFHSVTYIFMISSQRGVNKIRGLIGHFKQMLAQIWIKFFIKGCSKSLLLKKNSRKFQGLVLGLVGLIYAKGNSVAHSACSRDSRPRDWSRLGSIFLVSVSPIISRDSRDWGQHYFLALCRPFQCVCFVMTMTLALDYNSVWNFMPRNSVWKSLSMNF